jgi:acyl dehydratase
MTNQKHNQQITVAITQTTIDRWAVVSGDFNPLHVSQKYANSTPFSGTIAHGHFALALMERLLMHRFGEAWLYGGQLRDTRFRAPIRPGRSYVAAARRSDHPGELHVEVRDADGALCVYGCAVLPPHLIPNQRG